MIWLHNSHQNHKFQTKRGGFFARTLTSAMNLKHNMLINTNMDKYNFKFFSTKSKSSPTYWKMKKHTNSSNYTSHNTNPKTHTHQTCITPLWHNTIIPSSIEHLTNIPMWHRTSYIQEHHNKHITTQIIRTYPYVSKWDNTSPITLWTSQ